jgi:chromosome partitioning protein
VGKLLRTVKLVRQSANRDLVIGGVIACMYDSRTCLANEILADIREHFGAKVFRTIVRKNIRLAEAPGFGVPITQYDPDCRGSADYRALAEEVVARESGIPAADAVQQPEEEQSAEDAPEQPSAVAAPPEPAPGTAAGAEPGQDERPAPAAEASGPLSAASHEEDAPAGPAPASAEVPVEPPEEGAAAALRRPDAPEDSD